MPSPQSLVTGAGGTTITAVIEAALASFIEADPSVEPKVRITSSERNWFEQLKIILDPARQSMSKIHINRFALYPNIKGRFLARFKLSALPTYQEAMANPKYNAWWQINIMHQAGKAGGFAHVGGAAIDVSVRQLDLAQKQGLMADLQSRGVRVLKEKTVKGLSIYDSAETPVSLEQAMVFHCTL